jgi:hypothetical protein
MSRPTFNETLMRKILLTGLFGAAIVNLLKKNSTPTKVLWVSDRDAIIDKYDGFAFDLILCLCNISYCQPIITCLLRNSNLCFKQADKLSLMN